jgi:hypothetical protein
LTDFVPLGGTLCCSRPKARRPGTRKRLASCVVSVGIRFTRLCGVVATEAIANQHIAALNEGKSALIVAPTHAECRAIGRVVRDRQKKRRILVERHTKFRRHDETRILIDWPVGTIIVTGPKALEFYEQFSNHRATLMRADGKDMLSVKMHLNSERQAEEDVQSMAPED